MRTVPRRGRIGAAEGGRREKTTGSFAAAAQRADPTTERNAAMEAIRLRIVLPTNVLFDGPVRRVTAESVRGAFCLLPRHADGVTALRPGIVSFEPAGNAEAGEVEGRRRFAAVGDGLLVKNGRDVTITARRAVVGGTLGQLHRQLAEWLEHVDERERIARTAVADLEVHFVRRFVRLQGRDRV
ncbi:MAG: F0F1 ATP synthase subunit epsilon [Planctomycetota bacterium]|nr:MAG: F0F1 ATP synthase subunit epsilon [Planctomycetota bacterium]